MRAINTKRPTLTRIEAIRFYRMARLICLLYGSEPDVYVGVSRANTIKPNHHTIFSMKL